MRWPGRVRSLSIISYFHLKIIRKPASLCRNAILRSWCRCSRGRRHRHAVVAQATYVRLTTPTLAATGLLVTRTRPMTMLLLTTPTPAVTGLLVTQKRLAAILPLRKVVASLFWGIGSHLDQLTQ
ncbi:hypothetical protein AUP68_06343 [Ilyonectria robusta]